MSRIFNLEFLFLNQCHKVLISVNSDTREPYVHVQLMDSLFKKLFHIEHIRYKGYSGYKSLELYKDPMLKRVLETIAKEVEKEINGSYAKVKSLLSFMR